MAKQTLDPVQVIRDRAERSSQSAVATELRVSRQYLHQVINGQRPLSDDVAARLGFERVWRRIPRKRNGAQAGARKASR